MILTLTQALFAFFMAGLGVGIMFTLMFTGARSYVRQKARKS